MSERGREVVSYQWSVVSGQFMGRFRWEGEASAEPKVDRFNSLKLVSWGPRGMGTAENAGGLKPTLRRRRWKWGTGSAALGNGRLPQV